LLANRWIGWNHFLPIPSIPQNPNPNPNERYREYVDGLLNMAFVERRGLSPERGA
jgi:hypothetical protein